MPGGPWLLDGDSTKKLVLRVDAHPEDGLEELFILEEALLYLRAVEALILARGAHSSQRQLRAFALFTFEVLLLGNEFTEFIADWKQLLHCRAFRSQLDLELLRPDVESITLVNQQLDLADPPPSGPSLVLHLALLRPRKFGPRAQIRSLVGFLSQPESDLVMFLGKLMLQLEGGAACRVQPVASEASYTQARLPLVDFSEPRKA